MSEMLKVTMLGTFSLTLGDNRLDDGSNRMKKVWLLLAYLICSRGSRPSQDSLLTLLQGGSDDGADPAGRLKTMLYRVRNMLNQLDPDAGHSWITRQSGTYVWDAALPMELDIDLFEALCKEAAAITEPALRLERYRQALALYRGDFLPKLAMEPWVMPLNTYYHRLYLEAVHAALTLMEEAGQWQDAADLCNQALQIEPYSEELYQHRMQCHLALEDRAAALHTYEQLSEMLFSNFGVMPADLSRELYRRASSASSGAVMPVDSLREQLKEINASRGALFCEYDFFRMLYQLQARAIARSGDSIHIALFSVRGVGGKELSRRSLSTAVDNLQQLICDNLRQGDVVTRCSASQLIIMLPQANYENSCLVCQRLLRAFGRQYPHSPVSIHYSVQPLEPVERS